MKTENRWTAVVVVGGVVIGAGALYWYYSNRKAQEASADQEEPTPKTASDSSETASTSSASAVKLCSCCTKPCKQPALRCSRCKVVYYCSRDCQKNSWPTHKTECQALNSKALPPAASTSAATSTSTEAGPSSSSTAAADVPSTSSAAPSVNGVGGESSSSGSAVKEDYEPKDFAGTILPAYLGQMASQQTDHLDKEFETSVFHFISGRYAEALEGFKGVMGMLEGGSTKRLMMADTLKWMGHCHNRLQDFDAASASFSRGAEIAEAAGKGKLQAECLAGGGAVLRAQGKGQEAVTQYEAALKVVQSCGDEDAEAGVLCALGGVLVATGEPKRAAELLKKSCDMREAQAMIMMTRGDNNGLATAVMEQAAAAVQLATARQLLQQWEAAEEAYSSALNVFEMIEDVDKVSKVLINLANLAELQIPGARSRAVEYRRKLYDCVSTHLPSFKQPPDCPLCEQSLKVGEVSSEEGTLLVLSCVHCCHEKCWGKVTRAAEEGELPTCPHCGEEVALM